MAIIKHFAKRIKNLVSAKKQIPVACSAVGSWSIPCFLKEEIDRQHRSIPNQRS